MESVFPGQWISLIVEHNSKIEKNHAFLTIFRVEKQFLKLIFITGQQIICILPVDCQI